MRTFGATTVTNGVLFNGVGYLQPPALRAYDASDGHLLAAVALMAPADSGVSVVGKMVYVGTGDSLSNVGGGVLALTVP